MPYSSELQWPRQQEVLKAGTNVSDATYVSVLEEFGSTE